jgi:hypothetical protein
VSVEGDSNLRLPPGTLAIPPCLNGHSAAHNPACTVNALDAVRGSASAQYMPTAELKQLEMPVIEWKGAPPGIAECSLLARLGVLEGPLLDDLLAKAAGEGASKAVAAHAVLTSRF